VFGTDAILTDLPQIIVSASVTKAENTINVINAGPVVIDDNASGLDGDLDTGRPTMCNAVVDQFLQCTRQAPITRADALDHVRLRHQTLTRVHFFAPLDRCDDRRSAVFLDDALFNHVMIVGSSLALACFLNAAAKSSLTGLITGRAALARCSALFNSRETKVRRLHN
jgi:hypothetical protein